MKKMNYLYFLEGEVMDMKKERVGFFEFIEKVYGLSWNDWDENYSGQQKKEIEDDYDYYYDHPSDYDRYFS
jgi:hypothetical protein